jgi:hypothetical protein
MSYNFKKIIDLDLVNEVPEGANVLIETDGATKRLPSTAIKPAPIQPDFAQNDSTAPDYVKNRTHYEEVIFRYTFDGNIEDKESVTIENVGRSAPAPQTSYVKISDNVLSASDLLGATMIVHGVVENEFPLPPKTVLDETSIYDDHAGCVAVVLNVIPIPFIFSVDKAMEVPAGIQSFIFPSAGTYVLYDEGGLVPIYCTELSKVNLRKLDSKYLPEHLPYEETAVVNEPLNITWDGNTEGLVCAVGFPFYKVSDAVLTDEQIKSATIVVGGEQISIASKWDDAPSITDELVVPCEEVVFVRKDGAVFDEMMMFPECGIYFIYAQGMHPTSLTTTEPVEHTKTIIVKKLDKKYLPDDIGGYTIFYVDFIDEKIYIDESIETEANSVDVETALSKGVIYFKKAHTGELYNSFELETGDSGYYIRILTMNYGNVNVQSVATSDFIGGAD